MQITSDTIAAIATPPGNGGVGIVRISGLAVKKIAVALQTKKLVPRQAQYSAFLDAEGHVIDSGISIYFPAPHSYTGEDILELQAHGGAIILDMLLRRVLSLGVRLAQPGEFTQRAFLNDKMDLAQAEAVADLIASSTEQSARSAQNSMRGVFSKLINELVEQLTELRIYVEAAIDFVDEEIDFLSDGIVKKKMLSLLTQINQIKKTATQGQILRDGMTVVLAGKPNTGKSSLLNVLAGHEAAIVTEIAGTTRDVVRERIQIDGMPLHIIDTAGLRNSDNAVEKEGIRRAHEEINRADRILLLIDVRDPESVDDLLKTLPETINVTKIFNKIDLIDALPKQLGNEQNCEIYMSIKTGAGLDLLTQHLKQSIGYNDATDNVFIARRRHIEALNQAHEFLADALRQLEINQAGELVAEELRQAQNSLAEITGQFHSDDLLGRIFSSFCIGK